MAYRRPRGVLRRLSLLIQDILEYLPDQQDEYRQVAKSGFKKTRIPRLSVPTIEPRP